MSFLSDGLKQISSSAASLLNYIKEEEIPVQITISCKGGVVYKFQRDDDKTIKFYNGEDFVQGFASNKIILEFVENFLLFDKCYIITWHREGEKGMTTQYKKETLERLLKLLVSEEVL